MAVFEVGKTNVSCEVMGGLFNEANVMQLVIIQTVRGLSLFNLF